MKQRIITAALLLLFTIPMFFEKIFTPYMYALSSVIVIVTVIEILNLKKEKKVYNIPITILTIILALIIAFSTAQFSFIDGLREKLADYDSLYYLIVLSILPVPIILKKEYDFSAFSLAMFAVFFVGIAMNSALNIMEYGFRYFGLLLTIVFATDALAFFFGVKFGKHKLIPRLSPKKSIEGSIAGLIGGVVFAVLFYYIIELINPDWKFDFSIWILIPFAVIISIFGQIGDLFASSIKRYYNIKDFGKILPGHGGIFDRFDSVFLVCIVSYVLYNSFGMI